MAKRQVKQQKVEWRGAYGEYIIGLPPRDMTMDEWESYPFEARQRGLKHEKFVIVDDTGEDAIAPDWPEVLVEPDGDLQEGEDDE